MDAPRIQYARSPDGVRIAYFVIGTGPPLVMTQASVVAYFDMEWRTSEACRAFFEALGESHTVICYDHRGAGSSDRDSTDFSLPALTGDLAAVVDQAGVQRFALFGQYHAAPAAITYAVEHPERVSRLILWHAYRRYSDLAENPQLEAVRSLIDKDWRLYTETLAMVSYGYGAGEPARSFAALIRESLDAKTLKASMAATREYDLTSQLRRLSMPTLVLHRRHHVRQPVEIARRLAAEIANAHLVLLDGEAFSWYLGDQSTVLRQINEFLAEEQSVEPATPASAKTRREAPAVRTILFTDIEGHTQMMQRLGDAKGRAVLREHERLTREALAAHGGAEVKTMSDGFMASFGSAQKALECVAALQRAFVLRQAQDERIEPLRIRVGVNAGEPIAEDDDLFGSSVILAARTASQAQGGEVLVTDVVRQLVAGKGFAFADRGEVMLRGFEDPVRLYELRWDTGVPA